MILSMTHQPYHGRLATMIARGKPVLACPECQTIHRRDRRATVLLKSWSHGWRITCPVCSSRLQEITEGKIYPPANAFDHVWDEARNGEEMLAGIDQLPTDRAAFAVALLHLLLLPRSRTRNDVQRQIWRGKVLDVVIPGFDDVDRHAPFTVHTATPLVAPLPIRVALLAGLWRTQNNPDLYDRIESACSGRESIRFDAAKIKLLADAHPAFSHLQHIRELRVRSGLAISCSESEEPPQSQDFVQRDSRSRTSPSSSTARQSQNCRPAIATAISSRCQRDVGRGRRRRSSRANTGPNFKTHRRTVSWETSRPRSASRSSTSR